MTTPAKATPNWRHVLPRHHLDTDVYTLALERTAYLMENFDRVIVAFSGGKDSTATINVALEVAHSDPRFERHLPLRTVFCDEEAIPVETADYVRRMGQRDDVALEWYCLPVKHRNACSRKHPNWWPWAPESEHLWCRPMPDEGITSLPGFPLNPPSARWSWPDVNGLLADPADGNTAQLMGIRAAESLTRHRAVTLYKTDNFIIKYTGPTSRHNIWKAYPVYDWTSKDVWTAPALKGWDYNHAYDRLEMAGVSIHQQRCSPAFGEEPIQKLQTFASCFPEVWEKMVDRVPGAAAAARYSRTELYSFGKQPEKPPGLPWPEFIAHYLGKHEPATTAQIATRVHSIIRRHYRRITLPILPTAPCPETGVSWNFLLMIASRGDFKERKQEAHKVDLDEQGRYSAKSWNRYITEMRAILAAGTQDELAYPGEFPADPLTLAPEYAREACR